MNGIANLLFEANMLKAIGRSGFAFLGAGKESVAEHSFMAAFIAYVLARGEPDADAGRLIAMCLVHDLPEARTGDLNHLQKNYVASDEKKAVEHLTRDVPFGAAIAGLLDEYREKKTLESRLAHDADQIALVLDLKVLSDKGHRPTEKWLPAVLGRIRTPAGKKLADDIMATEWDAWWLKNVVDIS